MAPAAVPLVGESSEQERLSTMVSAPQDQINSMNSTLHHLDSDWGSMMAKAPTPKPNKMRPRRRSSHLNLAPTAADIGGDGSCLAAKERAKEQARLDQQRKADEMIQNTQRQMQELQQQMLLSKNQQALAFQTIEDAESTLTKAAVEVDDEDELIAPSKERRRVTQEYLNATINSVVNIPKLTQDSEDDEDNYHITLTEEELQELTQEHQARQQEHEDLELQLLQELQAEDVAPVAVNLDLSSEEEEEDRAGWSSHDDDDSFLSSEDDEDDFLFTSDEDEMSISSEEEEEKKETDPLRDLSFASRRRRRSQQSNASKGTTASQKSNALLPQRKATVDCDTSSSNLQHWKNGRRGKSSEAPPHQPPHNHRGGTSSRMSRSDNRDGQRRGSGGGFEELQRIAGHTDSEDEELSFFDWKHHRRQSKRNSKRRHSMDVKCKPPPDKPIRGMGSASDPNHSVTVRRSRRKQTTATAAIEEETESLMGSMSSLNRSMAHMQAMSMSISSIHTGQETQRTSNKHKKPSSQADDDDGLPGLETFPTPSQPAAPTPPTPPQKVQPRSVTHPRPKQPIFMRQAHSPPRERRQSLLDDVGKSIFPDEFEDDENDDDMITSRDKNVLQLSSSWNDLFTTTTTQVAQQQMAMPKRRGSESSASGDGSNILQFEPDEEESKRQAEENIARARKKYDLLKLSGHSNQGGIFVNDDEEEEETNKASFDENFNKSIDSWAKGSNAMNDGSKNSHNNSFGSKSDSHLLRGSPLGDHPEGSNTQLFDLFSTSTSSHGGFDFHSQSSDTPSKLLRRFTDPAKVINPASQHSEDVATESKTGLMEHLKKHGSKPKPGWRWDKSTINNKNDGGLNTSGHYSGSGGGTIVSGASGSRGSGSRSKGTNPMKELRKSQRDKKNQQEQEASISLSSNSQDQSQPGSHEERMNEFKSAVQKDKRQSLSALLEKDKEDLNAKVPDLVGPSATSVVASEITTPASEMPSSSEHSARGRRLPSRERRTPGRTRSRSLTDLQRLKKPSANGGGSPARFSPPPPPPGTTYRVADNDDSSSVEDPMISKYKELVGDLVEQEKTSQTAAAIVKGEQPKLVKEDAAREDAHGQEDTYDFEGDHNDLKPAGEVAASPPNDKTRYNWNRSHSRRRASYDWMQHKTHDAANNMLAFVGNDILAAANRSDDDDDQEVEEDPPAVERSDSMNDGSLTNLVIEVDEDWKLDKPDFNWSEYDPKQTTDSVKHFIGATPSGSLANMVPNHNRRDMMTSGQRPSFSSTSERSMDIAAKKPQRRYTQLAQGVEDKVAGDAQLHESFTNIHQHATQAQNILPTAFAEGSEEEKSVFSVVTDTDSSDAEENVVIPSAQKKGTKGKGSLGAFLQSSSNDKSADEINRIFDWTNALHKGTLEKPAMNGTSDPQSEASEEVDIKDDARHHSLREFIVSSSNEARAKQASVAAGTAGPTIGTGDAVLEDKSADEVGRSRDRRQKGVQRTRSKSLTDMGRAGRRQKDEAPKVSRRRDSVKRNLSLENSLQDFLEKDKTGPPNDLNVTNRTTRSRDSGDRPKIPPKSAAGKPKGKAANESAPRRQTVAGTTKRLSTSMHLNVKDPTVLGSRPGRGEDRRPQLNRRRSSSLSDMDGMDKERHAKRGSTTKPRGGRRSSEAPPNKPPQSDRPQPRRRRPERQRSRSLTDMGQGGSGGRRNAKEAAAGEGNARPGMVSGYNWEEHGTSTDSMMSNSSKPPRDRRAMLVRTRSQSLSNLFGQQDRSSRSLVSNASSKTPPRTYNWSKHRQNEEGTTSPGGSPKRPERHSRGGKRTTNKARRKTMEARSGSPNGEEGTMNESDPAHTSKSLREQLVRSASRSLTDLVSLVNTTIEESPFENSGSRTTLEASGSLQASGGSLQASTSDLSTDEGSPEKQKLASGASRRSTATTADSNISHESDGPGMMDDERERSQTVTPVFELDATCH